MYRVSEEQIEFILDDIKKRGIEMEDLQLNLLDHICCILEKDLNETDDFNEKYNKTIKQFFKTELSEIEEETKLLTRFKNYYQMKRFLYILLVLSIGYNAFVLSKIGYDFYRMRKWQSDQELMKKVDYFEGFTDFKNKLKAEHPDVLKNKYIYIAYSIDLLEDDLHPSTLDTSFVNELARSRTSRLKLDDSLAAEFFRNVSFVFAYGYDNSMILDEIEKNKKNTKYMTYVSGVRTFLSGYRNEKQKKGIWLPTTIIIDTTGKIIYEKGFPAKRIDNKLISTLKSLQ